MITTERHPILEIEVFQNKTPLIDSIKIAATRIEEIRHYDLEIHPKIYDKFCELIALLNKLQTQLEILQAIISGENYENDYLHLDEFNFQNIDKENLSENVVSHMIIYLKTSLLDRIYSVIQKSTNLQFFDEELTVLLPKFKVSIRSIPYAARIKKSDVFSSTPTEDKLSHLGGFITVKSLGTKEKVTSSYHKFLAQLFIGTATIIQGDKQKGNFMKGLYKYCSAPYYASRLSATKRLIELFIANPNECVFKSWDTFDDPLIAPIFNMIIPGIKTNKMIEIDRNYPEINLEVVERAVKENLWEDLSKEFFVSNINKNSKHGKIPIRILSPYQLPKKNGEIVDKIVIHIHGGGWVAMSSHSHQIYTRRWALSLGLPVFSIDYRLAPKHKYPEGLDDCWQAYNWIIDNAQKFGINPKKIILVGESAGGNLALSLTNIAIRTGKRVPDGLYLAYPGLYLSEKYYTPSFLKAMDDGLVAYSYLELFLKAYLPSPEIGINDPLASPIITPNSIFKSYPPVRISAGTGDPLHDECWRLAYNLKNLGRDVKLTSYQHMPHGYMLNCIPGGMKESLVCINDAADAIKEIFGLSN